MPNMPKPRRDLWRRLLWWPAMVLAFGAGWWFALGQSHPTAKTTLPASGQRYSEDVMLVTVAPVEQRNVTRSVEAVGNVNGYEEVAVSANVEGRVIRIHHDLSSRVKPGELLLEMDPTERQLAVNQAERNVQAELAKWGFNGVPREGEDLSKLPTVNIARLKYELARSSFERLLKLKETNSIAIEELEKANADALVAESEWKHQSLMAQSAAATARLRQAELAIAQQKLADTKIYAPIPTRQASEYDTDYFVSERMVSEGTLLRSGTEVFKLVLGRTRKLRLTVPESLGSKIAVGQMVEVSCATSDHPTTGTVARIGPSVDRSTRTFLVEVEVPNNDGSLKPGAFAKAKIETSSSSKATTIPLSGLYSFAGINKIFLFEQGKAREVKVTLGEQTPEWVEIASPEIPVGALVLTSGQRLISDGMAVEIRSPESEGLVETEKIPADAQSPNATSSAKESESR